jgi:hypothetical protein
MPARPHRDRRPIARFPPSRPILRLGALSRWTNDPIRCQKRDASASARSSSASFAAPWSRGLVLAGIADILSGDPVVHGMALVGVGVVIAIDARRHGSEPEGVRARPREIPLVRVTAPRILVAAAFAILVGAFARYSWPVTIAVAIPAASGVVIAWRTPAGRTDPGPLDRRGALAWTGVFLTLALFELTNLLLQPSLVRSSPSHPTVSVLLDPVLASHPARTAFLAVWLSCGWFLIER